MKYLIVFLIINLILCESSVEILKNIPKKVKMSELL